MPIPINICKTLLVYGLFLIGGQIYKTKIQYCQKRALLKETSEYLYYFIYYKGNDSGLELCKVRNGFFSSSFQQNRSGHVSHLEDILSQLSKYWCHCGNLAVLQRPVVVDGTNHQILYPLGNFWMYCSVNCKTNQHHSPTPLPVISPSYNIPAEVIVVSIPPPKNQRLHFKQCQWDLLIC